VADLMNAALGEVDRSDTAQDFIDDATPEQQKGECWSNAIIIYTNGQFATCPNAWFISERKKSAGSSQVTTS